MNTKKKIILYLLLTAGAALMLSPLLWMVSTSLKDPANVMKMPPEWIPDPVRIENYSEACQAIPMGRFYLNSLFIAITVTVCQVMTSAMSAYAFARMKFPLRDKMFFGYLATLMIPATITMIPVFILLQQLGWIDSYKALIIPGIFSAYGTFMLRQFFMTIPVDLENAAKIDGCGHFRIFFNIVLPLSKPALATLTVFTFMGNWRSFIWPLIVTQSIEKKTLPVGLTAFQGQYSGDWHLLMAASVVAIVPVVIVFIFNQKHFVKGIKLSGFGGT
ncbi:MAG: carbohydrate ABC transporter permease [Phycisphaerae bacterium]|nr:carbohydrate ABC transporter permease [Phycisphaerae bacterium]